MLPLLNAQHAVNRNNIEIMWQFYLLSYFCLVKWFSILYQTHFCTDWLIDWCLAPTLASISAISWRKQLYCCLIINHKHISTVNVFKRVFSNYYIYLINWHFEKLIISWFFSVSCLSIMWGHSVRFRSIY